MNEKSINSDNKNIKKSNFYDKNKKLFNIDNIDVNKILVSKKEQYGKYQTIIPIFSQSIEYINNFDKNKITVSLVAKDKQLLEKYIKIWKKN